MYERSVHKPPGPNQPEPRRHLGRFPRCATSVKEVRDWLRRRMELRPTSARIPTAVTEDALLITSEITTNALLHTPDSGRHGAFVVSAFFYTYCLRVSIRCAGIEQAHVPLRVVRPTSDCENGRGLVLVNALAATWGTEPTRSGSAVYYTLDWGAPEQVDPRTMLASMPVSRG